MAITTILADDHALVRQALRLLLDSEPGIEVVAEAADGLEAVALVERHRPRVLVVELILPGLSGLGVVRRVAKEQPYTACVLLSMHAHETCLTEALQSGAYGYVPKEADSAELVAAIRHAAAGKRYLSSELSERAIAAYQERSRAPRARDADGGELSSREEEVLHHTVSGATSAQVADRLFISPRTVEKHRQSLMQKLGVHSQRELILYAVSRGILPRTVQAAYESPLHRSRIRLAENTGAKG
jgi:DNA-binding NarL/FixJ family response regulator